MPLYLHKMDSISNVAIIVAMVILTSYNGFTNTRNTIASVNNRLHVHPGKRSRAVLVFTTEPTMVVVSSYIHIQYLAILKLCSKIHHQHDHYHNIIQIGA